MSALEILAVIGIIGYVIYQQVKGQPLRGKRTVLLLAAGMSGTSAGTGRDVAP